MIKTAQKWLACVSRLVICASAVAVSSPGTAGPAAVSGPSAPRNVSAPAAARRPNILVIIMDDLGYADVSAYHRGRIPTPNIDRIARDGALFRQGYVSAPICSPSRAGLMTGRHQQRFGFEYNNGPGRLDQAEHRGLDPRERTLADVLKAGGYRTGAIGKWHLGWNDEHYPTNRGFDHFWGLLTGQTNFIRPDAPTAVNAFPPSRPGDGRELAQPYQVVAPTEQIVTGPTRTVVDMGDRHMTEVMTDEALRFIDAGGDQPFFLYLAHNAPHTPLQTTREWYDRFAHIPNTTQRVYAAMVAMADHQIGRVLNHLEAKGLAQNTVVVLLSDNGCAAYIPDLCSAEPLAGGKLTYLEGGVRVPFMMRWPGKVRPGQTVDRPVSSLDIFPTAVAAAGLRLPADRDYDGMDLVAQLKTTKARPPLFWRTSPMAAVRQGDWKYVRDANGQELLYNLKADPGETRNLISSDAAQADLMRSAHAAWSAKMVNPLWKPRTTEFSFGGRSFKFLP